MHQEGGWVIISRKNLMSNFSIKTKEGEEIWYNNMDVETNVKPLQLNFFHNICFTVVKYVSDFSIVCFCPLFSCLLHFMKAVVTRMAIFLILSSVMWVCYSCIKLRHSGISHFVFISLDSHKHATHGVMYQLKSNGDYYKTTYFG